MQSNLTLQRTDFTTLSADIRERVAKFEQITGRAIEVYKNEDGEVVNFWHPESTAQANFFVEFFRVGFSSPDGNTAAVENLARRYAELREELMERYQDDQDTLYKRMSDLNQAFEGALQSTTLMPLPMISETSFLISSNDPASVNNQIKQDARNHENMKNIMRHIQNSLTRGMNVFFENFIREIESGDFQSAFDSSMETAKSGESQSLENMSFADAVRMRDTISRWEEVEDKENERTVGRLQNLNTSFWSISRDENISLILRREIADLLGFNAPITTTKTEAAELTHAQMLARGMMSGAGNGNPNLTGSPIQVLNAKLFNLSIAFGEIAAQSGTNINALRSEFRAMVLSLFDDAVLALHGKTDDVQKLQQLRAESRSAAESFLNRFYNWMDTITEQNLRDTGMGRAELAFHEAMNFVYHEVGMAVLGGTDAVAGKPQFFGLDGKPVVFQTEEEFRRLVMEALLDAARHNAEIKRQWAENNAKEAERWRKILLIAARIARGDNVPPQDRKFLLAHSPGMYMIANASQTENKNPQDHKSELSGNGQSTDNIETV